MKHFRSGNTSMNWSVTDGSSCETMSIALSEMTDVSSCLPSSNALACFQNQVSKLEWSLSSHRFFVFTFRGYICVKLSLPRLSGFPIYFIKQVKFIFIIFNCKLLFKNNIKRGRSWSIFRKTSKLVPDVRTDQLGIWGPVPTVQPWTSSQPERLTWTNGNSYSSTNQA